MKTRFSLIAIFHLLSSVCVSTFAQGTAFTYQGRLNDGANPASGTYDFRFKLFQDPYGNNQAGSSVLTNGLAITNGLFTVAIDFGPGIFNGSNYWLEVDVRTNTGSSYTDLNPLQSITPAPYAIFAATASNVSGTISSAGLAGVYGGTVTFSNVANQFTGSFAGNGANVTNVNAATLGGLSASNLWRTGGNAGTTAGTNFVGTTDNQPLELHANGLRVSRLEAAPNDDANISNAVNAVNGSPANFIRPGIKGATIAGGGALFYFGSGTGNTVADNFGTIGGGVGNVILSNAWESTIGGGNANAVYPGAYRSTIGGGWYNQIETNASHSSIVGGFNNTAYGSYGAIGGGHYNITGNTNMDASEATVAGGAFNTASGISSFIGGGAYNLVYGNNATVAGGLQNRANYHAFVGSGYDNAADGIEATIGGGRFNSIDTNAYDSVIGGGDQNYILGTGSYACIGGGYANTNQGTSSTIGGGQFNIASNFFATVGGGAQNTANGMSATVSGGALNMASTNYATIAGGGNNVASGSAAFIGGGGIQEVGGGAFYLHGNLASGQGSVVGGGMGNVAGGTTAFVGGGGFDGNTVAGNNVQATAGVICGGLANSISSGGGFAFIGGGSNNVASGKGSALGGGWGNTAGPGNAATVGGGLGNGNSGNYSTLCGGLHNGINNDYSTLCGGVQNTNAGGYGTIGGGTLNYVAGSYATVPGGIANSAIGQYCFAAGYSAHAVNDGAFVWADGQGSAYSSDRNNQFKIRAGGGMILDVSGSSGLNPAALRISSTSANGVGIFVAQTSSDATAVFTAAGTGNIIKGFGSGGEVFDVVNSGDVYAHGVLLTSDRNAKENFGNISAADILDKVAALPITQWNFKTDSPKQKHIGPMAQDFHATFGLNGADDKHIATVDESGVALAAIQGLNAKLEDRSQKLEAENADLKQKNDSLEKRLEALEQIILNHKSN